MFCPNCGNNCGDARFCPSCGTKLPQAAAPAAQSGEWKVGMPCPHCGATKLDGDCCAFCGAQLILPVPKQTEEVSLEIPFGTYKGINSSLTLYEKDCVVYTAGIFRKWTTRMPYDKITTLIYARTPHRGTMGSFLLFRWEGNRNIPTPSTDYAYNLGSDKTVITVPVRDDVLFYHLYCMLKALVPETAECLELFNHKNVNGVDSLANVVDMDWYFTEYAPFREKAVEGLIKRTGASKEIAQALVEREFDIRQKAMYAANPIAAIQDLNRFLGRKIQLEKEARKALEARRERYRQEETLRRLEQLEREARRNR